MFWEKIFEITLALNESFTTRDITQLKNETKKLTWTDPTNVEFSEVDWIPCFL